MTDRDLLRVASEQPRSDPHVCRPSAQSPTRSGTLRWSAHVNEAPPIVRHIRSEPPPHDEERTVLSMAELVGAMHRALAAGRR